MVDPHLIFLPEFDREPGRKFQRIFLKLLENLEV